MMDKFNSKRNAQNSAGKEYTSSVHDAELEKESYKNGSNAVNKKNGGASDYSPNANGVSDSARNSAENRK